MDSDDIDEIFGNEDFSERFFAMLNSEGMAASVVDVGIVIGFSKDKIIDMLDMIAEGKDDNIVILIKKRLDIPDTVELPS